MDYRDDLPSAVRGQLWALAGGQRSIPLTVRTPILKPQRGKKARICSFFRAARCVFTGSASQRPCRTGGGPPSGSPPVLSQLVRLRFATSATSRVVVQLGRATYLTYAAAGTMTRAILLVVLIAFSTASARANMAQGEALYQSGDFAAALRLMEPDAKSGNAQAQYYLGQMYRKGQGVAADLAEGMEWLERAARGGSAEAMNVLAAVYRRGDGVPQDFARAVYWHRRAADLGFENAQYRLALMYEAGQGAPRNLEEAYKWAYIAATQGQPEPKRFRDKLARQLTQQQRAVAEQEGDMYLVAVSSRLAAIEAQKAAGAAATKVPGSSGAPTIGGSVGVTAPAPSAIATQLAPPPIPSAVPTPAPAALVPAMTGHPPPAVPVPQVVQPAILPASVPQPTAVPPSRCVQVCEAKLDFEYARCGSWPWRLDAACVTKAATRQAICAQTCG